MPALLTRVSRPHLAITPSTISVMLSRPHRPRGLRVSPPVDFDQLDGLLHGLEVDVADGDLAPLWRT